MYSALILCCRTIQTAVLIETLVALGAEVSWSSCVRAQASGLHMGTNFFSLYRTFSLPRTTLLPRSCLHYYP